MKTTTSRISQAIDAIKLSLDDSKEASHTAALTPVEALNQLAQEVESLQAKKAGLLAEIEELEKRKAALSGKTIKKSAKKPIQKPVAKLENKTPVVDPQEALSQLKAAFEGF